MSAEVYERRFGHEPGQWICPGHWLRLTKRERAVWRRVHRQRKTRAGLVDYRREDRIWRRLVARADARPPREATDLL